MVIAIENIEVTCMKCLGEFEKLNEYHLYGRGYGSSFDNTSSKIQLCDECDNKNIEGWFNEEPTLDEYCEEYKLESEIIKFTNELPIQGRELFENTFAYGAGTWSLPPQDWIDIELGIASDEVYEENCMYSPRQIRAYEERFPTCDYPVNVTHSDSSKGCWCPYGAHGEYGQKVGLNISDECYGCELYKVREKPIKEMDRNTYKKYEEYMRGQLHKGLFE